jgi:NitT/TauT family transport system permease protein
MIDGARVTTRVRATRTMSWPVRISAQVAIVAALLAAWEYLPKIEYLRTNFHFLNPFFISSPSRVIRRMYALAVGNVGSGPRVTVWPNLWHTAEAMLVGFVIGSCAGFIIAVWMANVPRAWEILGFLIKTVNTLPRIALIPIIILLIGPAGNRAGMAAASLTVFFIVFFSAYEGGKRTPVPILNNARVLGARPVQVMAQFRLPYVALFAFGVAPNALAFALFTTVATEILGGSGGMGILLVTATSLLDATTTMAIVIYLGIFGVLLVQIAEAVKRRVLHWAEG